MRPKGPSDNPVHEPNTEPAEKKTPRRSPEEKLTDVQALLKKLDSEIEEKQKAQLAVDPAVIRKQAAQQRAMEALQKRIEDKNKALEAYEKHTIKRRNKNSVLKQGVSLKNTLALIARSQKRSDELVERESQYLPQEFQQSMSPRIGFELVEHPQHHPEKTVIYATPGLPIGNLYKLTKEFESVTIEARLRHPIGEFAISLPPDVRIPREQAIWMLQRHMVRSGADPDQHDYIVIEHENKEHQHFHLRYKRERHDGGYHHILGANYVCHLEAEVQTRLFEQKTPLEGKKEHKIKALTAYSATAAKVENLLAKGLHCAEIRYKDRVVKVPTTGPEADIRLKELGFVEMFSGGGLAKHLIDRKFKSGHYLGVE
jgi:hypothetical protein